MLLDLRETVRNSKPIKYTLITIIIIPFALVGIGSYLSGGSAPPIAEVNGQTIDQQQLERAYQQQRQQMARMFGGQLPEAFANEALLREQALQQLISQQVLESEVVSQGFAVGDATLGRAIRELPVFQVDGQFDSDTYQNQLRASGMSVAAFEQSFRDDTALNQFRSGVSDTAFTLPSEAERLDALRRQTRTIDAVRFDLAKAADTIELTEEEITAWFEENRENYRFPERVKIRYIELDSAEIAAAIDISDEQAQSYYDENRANYVLPEQREASHILLSEDRGDVDERLALVEELKQRIEAGESFGDLAAEFSDDIGTAEQGGSLGVIASGAMDADFEEAVFALPEQGSLSDAVVTPFGVHLIRLDKITPESGKPFDEVREQIITELQQNEADREFFDLREVLSEQAFDFPDSLEAASEATGLEIKSSDWLDNETDSGPLLSNPAVFSAAFSNEVLDEQLNSDIIEIEDRHVLVLRVIEHEGERDKTLEDVREEVESALRNERAAEQLADSQAQASERLAAGESAAAIAAGDEFASALEALVLERQSQELDARVLTRVFALPHPDGETSVTETTQMSNGDLIALRLESVDVAEAAVDENGASPGRIANPQLGGTEFEALLESLRNAADVEIKAASSS